MFFWEYNINCRLNDAYLCRAANHSDFGGVLSVFLCHSAHSDIFEIPPLFAILLYKKKVVRISFGRLVYLEKSGNAGVSRLVTKSILQCKRVTFGK